MSWPGTIARFAELGSTNDYLKARAGELPEWTVVLAETQTSGRGRAGHAWASAPGNLHLSTLLRFPARDPRLPVLSLAVGVVVAVAIAEVADLDARLKWPNDVVSARGKLGGILCEGLTGRSGEIETVVVGIGVNVVRAPRLETGNRASCLNDEARRSVDAETLAAEILRGLRLWYDARPDGAAVVERWRGHAVPWWGSEVEVVSPEGPLRGVARDVDERGALVIELRDGSRRALLSGEVRELRRRGSQARVRGR